MRKSTPVFLTILFSLILFSSIESANASHNTCQPDGGDGGNSLYNNNGSPGTDGIGCVGAGGVGGAGGTLSSPNGKKGGDATGANAGGGGGGGGAYAGNGGGGGNGRGGGAGGAGTVGGVGINGGPGGNGGIGGDGGTGYSGSEPGQGGQGGLGAEGCGGIGTPGGDKGARGRLGSFGGSGGPGCDPPVATCQNASGGNVDVKWTWGASTSNPSTTVARLMVYAASGSRIVYEIVDGTGGYTMTVPSGTHLRGRISYNGVEIKGAYSAITTIICTTAPPTPTPTPSSFSIAGSVFNDINKNGIKDGGESNYTGGSSDFILSGNSSSSLTTPSGSYNFPNLAAGSYNVSYTSLPDGYQIIAPQNGPPPSRSVTVGPNASSVDFAISNSNAWIQTYDMDIRFDNGYDSLLPNLKFASAISSTSTTPGVIFTGDADAEFGQGSGSTTGWVVGGSAYPEVLRFTSGARRSTAYAYILNKASRLGIDIIDLSTLTGCASPPLGCSLPADLASGIYQTDGHLQLNSFTSPANRNYLILAGGNITISGNLITPTSSTFLISSGGNISIAASVGTTPSPTPPAGQIQGFLSADRNFLIEGNGSCTTPDLMLNVDGGIVVNASGAGGILTNNRDLCGDNHTSPSFTVKPRLDFLLNAPTLIQNTTNFSREVAP